MPVDRSCQRVESQQHQQQQRHKTTVETVSAKLLLSTGE